MGEGTGSVWLMTGMFLFRFADRCKEVRSDRLHKVYKRKEQKNTKIADRKLEVAFGAISENGYDLPWHKLEQQKCNERDHKSTGRGEQIGRLYPFVFFCAIVIAGDWL